MSNISIGQVLDTTLRINNESDPDRVFGIEAKATVSAPQSVVLSDGTVSDLATSQMLASFSISGSAISVACFCTDSEKARAYFDSILSFANSAQADLSLQNISI